jgi:hypothetical protein
MQPNAPKSPLWLRSLECAGSPAQMRDGAKAQLVDAGSEKVDGGVHLPGSCADGEAE